MPTRFFFNHITSSAGIDLSKFFVLKDGSQVSEKYSSFGVIVNLLVSNLFIIAGLIIFFMIIGAGLSFLKDTDKGKDDAKNLVSGAVIGFLVMFCAYWIVQIVKLITKTDIPI